MNLHKILVTFRDTHTVKRSSLAECEGKIISLVTDLREGLIHDLNARIKIDGYHEHVIREVVTRKFDEL